VRPIINRNAFRDVLNYVPEYDENVVTSMGEHLQCARHENQNVFTLDKDGPWPRIQSKTGFFLNSYP